MKKNKLKLSIVALLTLGISTLQAQEVTLTIGGDASGSGGSESYSVGQVVYTTNTGTTGSVAQGVQQPYEISEVTGIPEVKDISILLSAYPNPTTDYLMLKVKNFQSSTLSYQLYDMNGRLLQNGNITGKQTNIVMHNLLPSTYYVKVTNENKEVKTFEVIKTQ